VSAPARPPLVARAPTRIDFGGGWTDVPPYDEERGGFVCNLAIARYATVRIELPPADSARAPDEAGARPDAASRAGELGLVGAALARSRVADAAAITLRSDFPIGAGLGGSSAAGVATVGALAALAGEPVAQLGRAALAERSRRIEVEDLHVAGGRQDHYAAAFGGALALGFAGGDRVDVQRIPLDAALRRELERRSLLLYTGQSRISGRTITAVLDAYRDREPRVVGALERMGALARRMADALRARSVDDLGRLVGEHWEHQRSLHPEITTPRIDEIVGRAAAAGALGTKALGASGGGCVLAIAADGAEDAVRRAVAGLAEELSFAVDTEGFAVE